MSKNRTSSKSIGNLPLLRKAPQDKLDLDVEEPPEEPPRKPLENLVEDPWEERDPSDELLESFTNE